MEYFRKQWFLLTILLVILLATGLRFYKLGQVPAGMTWDEAAIGYNGYAVRIFRRDEWLVRLPVSFKSFGDYKAPLAIYLSGFFTWIFGLNLWAVRFPFALTSIFTILGMIWLTYLWLSSLKSFPINYIKISTLFVGFLMATSPWHFHFSRAGFESGIALGLIIWGVVSFLLALNPRTVIKNEKNRILFQLIALVVSAICLSLSLYAYHSAKIVFPLLGIFLLISHFNQLKSIWKILILPVLLSIVILRPLVMDTLYGQGGERFSQTSVFDGQLAGFELVQIIVSNYLKHLTPTFLILGETTTLRHGDGSWGVLHLTELVLVLIGVVYLILVIASYRKKKFNLTSLIPFLSIKMDKQTSRNLLLFPIMWLLIGILPAAIGNEVPHSNRILLAYPGFLLLAGYGFLMLLQNFDYFSSQADKLWNKFWGKHLEFSDTAMIFRASIGMVVLVHLLLTVVYLNNYYTRYAYLSEHDFYYGYQQAFEFAIEKEDQVDKILFTSEYGQPYIYALFFRQTHPQWYQGGSLIKYEFTDQISEADLHRKNTIIVATPEEIDPSLADQLVIAPSGQVRFVLVETDK